MGKHKIYCFANGGSPGWYQAIALGDDGTCLAQHICSSEGFVEHDLGVTSTWKHDSYDNHFGEGNWETEFVPMDKVNDHPGIETAYQKNQEQGEKAKVS